MILRWEMVQQSTTSVFGSHPRSVSGRHGEEMNSTCFQNTRYLSKGGRHVGNVFQDVTGHYEVKRSVIERERRNILATITIRSKAPAHISRRIVRGDVLL
jgi:hypothetical protein